MSHALERVKITRPGRLLTAAALIALAMPAALRAQETPAEPGTHVVKRGDTLWDLAKTYLGDAYLWPEIYRLNTDQIDDPHWIYPSEVLKLPGHAAVAAAPPAAPGETQVVETPRRALGPTVFTPRTLAHPRMSGTSTVPAAHVLFGDVIKAPYFDRIKGPATHGRVVFSADIPGIAMPRNTTNFQLFDRLLMVPPAGSLAAVHDRFIAYTLGEDIEDVGTMVIPSALLEVVRAPQQDEPAIVQVRELYTQLNADDRVIPLDTAGTGSPDTPTPVPAGAVRSTTIRAIHRAVELPSVDYYVLFDLSSHDGMRVGDEVLFYREREAQKSDDGPTLPEVVLATGQVVRVTAYGATARVTTMEQPLLRVGEHVRVTARMP